MELLTDITDYQSSHDRVLTVGTFDGVHLGHQKIIEAIIESAKKRNLKSTVVTFDPHPKEVISTPDGTDKIELLTTLEEKLEALSKFDIDTVIVIQFTMEFSRTDPDAFVTDILCKKFKAKEIIVGYDHNFGKDRSGNHKTLLSLGEKCGFSVKMVGPFDLMDGAVSSTRIRKLLSGEGDVETASKLLSRLYSITGSVVKGEGRGRKINFPTANIKLHNDSKVIPKNGVYCVNVLRDGKSQKGMCNIGFRPTFDGSDRTIEAHILSDDLGDLYGEEISLEYISRLRDEFRFNSSEELIKQLQKDKLACSI
ncbi:MAG: bifunctional riboflavin kinase/FAD synthetase [Candidatus Marinimicrobia bacterium]|nr:bifunctional riboflavin kinase/FAD synthetase [Candidatus Neomarinimicrobiota bacterium]